MEKIYTDRKLEKLENHSLALLQEQFSMSSLNTPQVPRLTSKIRIVVNHRKTAKLPKRRLQFYRRYAAFVQKNLRKPLFQRFLRWMLKRESIEKQRVRDIQVRMLPFRKDNGNILVGRCNRTGEILICPKRLDSCRRLISKFGKESALLYIKTRARAALIHELLHLKYSSNEEKVRRLTEKYLKIFTRRAQNIPNSRLHTVLGILFPN